LCYPLERRQEGRTLAEAWRRSRELDCIWQAITCYKPITLANLVPYSRLLTLDGAWHVSKKMIACNIKDGESHGGALLQSCRKKRPKSALSFASCSATRRAQPASSIERGTQELLRPFARTGLSASTLPPPASTPFTPSSFSILHPVAPLRASSLKTSARHDEVVGMKRKRDKE
jgi:hypothetical protein